MSKISIIGAGAIDNYIGAHFVASGIDVTLIDAWAEHVEAMRQTGITFEGINGVASVKTPVHSLHISDVPQP